MMTDPRADALAARLEKGRQKTFEIFNALTLEQWQQPLYHEPDWQVRHLLAHFVSAENQLLALAQSVAAGGPGAPPDFDYDRFNADEQSRLEGQSLSILLETLDQARQGTIVWVRTLDASQLEMVGRHPVLGDVTVETMVTAIYGHQLIHMRELSRLLGSVV
ncbi:MAG: DinB family protein [Chloroflexi bacterium]|nr:DinB family protein [Chloroflexota bacterium]